MLDNPTVIDWLLEPYNKMPSGQLMDYAAYKEEQYNKLAEHVRAHVNLPLLYQILQGND